MKVFRGTLGAAVALLLLLLLVFVVEPEMLSVADESGPPRIFEFEKHEVVRVEVVKPGDEAVVLDGCHVLPPWSRRDAARRRCIIPASQVHPLVGVALLYETKAKPHCSVRRGRRRRLRGRQRCGLARRQHVPPR